MRFVKGLAMIMLSLVIASGCVSGSGTYGNARPDDRLRVCITNSSIDTHRLQYDGRFIGSVYPGESRWVFISGGIYRAQGDLLIAVNSNTYQSPIYVDITATAEWVWELTNNRIVNQLSLEPARGPTRCD